MNNVLSLDTEKVVTVKFQEQNAFAIFDIG